MNHWWPTQTVRSVTLYAQSHHKQHTERPGQFTDHQPPPDTPQLQSVHSPLESDTKITFLHMRVEHSALTSAKDDSSLKCFCKTEKMCYPSCRNISVKSWRGSVLEGFLVSSYCSVLLQIESQITSKGLIWWCKKARHEMSMKTLNEAALCLSFLLKFFLF